jgi:hypothetical protein
MPADTFTLHGGDGTTVDLTDQTKHFILYEMLRQFAPISVEDDFVLALPVLILGSTIDTMWTNFGSIQTALEQAALSYGAAQAHATTRFEMNYGTTGSVFARVRRGRIVPQEMLPGGKQMVAVIELNCRAGLVDSGVGDALSSALTAGLSAYVLRQNLGADKLSEARLGLLDIGSGVINRVQWACRHQRGITASSYVPLIAATAVSPGTETTDGSTYIGSGFARLLTTEDWQTVCEFTRGDLKHLAGLHLLDLRVRDHSVVVPTPTSLAVRAGQIRAVQEAAATYQSTSSSFVATWNQSTTLGNYLWLVVYTMPVSGTPQTISTPAGWTAGPTISQDNNARIATFYKENAASESGTVTVTLGGATRGYIRIMEFAGIALSSSLDRTDTSNVTAADSITSTTAAITQANELALVAFASTENTNDTVMTTGVSDGAGGSWTNVAALNPYVSLRVAYKVTTSTGAVSTVFNPPGSSDSAIVVTMTVKGASTSAGTLTATTWETRIAAVDTNGKESIASESVSFELTSTGALLLTYDASATAVSYKGYYRSGTGTWKYKTSTALSLIISADDGTAGDPILSSSLKAYLRFQAGIADGVSLATSDEFQVELANGVWERCRGGTQQLPPAPTAEWQDADDWVLRVQAKHESGGANLDVNGLWPVRVDQPHGRLTYRGTEGELMAATTPQLWVMESRPDGRRRAICYGQSITLTNSGAAVNADGSVRVEYADTLKAVLSTLDETTGWLAMAVKPTWDNASEPAGGSGLVPFFQWGDDGNNKLALYYDETNNRFQFERKATTASTADVSQAITSGQLYHLIARWTATTIYLTVDTVTDDTANTLIPTLASTDVWLGSNGSNGCASDIYSLALGAGTLTSADLTTIDGWGAHCPVPDQFPSEAKLRLLWWGGRTDKAINPRDAALPEVEGTFALGHDDTLIGLDAALADGAHNVSTAQFRASVFTRRKYAFLRGAR